MAITKYASLGGRKQLGRNKPAHHLLTRKMVQALQAGIHWRSRLYTMQVVALELQKQLPRAWMRSKLRLKKRTAFGWPSESDERKDAGRGEEKRR